MLANRLSANPDRRVLLLEAGPEPTSPWIKIPAGVARVFQPGPYNWAYTSEPEPELQNRPMYWPRGKTLGGSSAINGMLYVRGNARDYDEWAQRGNTGWSWSDVLPFFKRSENQQRGASEAHGDKGELSVSDPIVRNAFSKRFIEAAVARAFDAIPISTQASRTASASAIHDQERLAALLLRSLRQTDSRPQKPHGRQRGADRANRHREPARRRRPLSQER